MNPSRLLIAAAAVLAAAASAHAQVQNETAGPRPRPSARPASELTRLIGDANRAVVFLGRLRSDAERQACLESQPGASVAKREALCGWEFYGTAFLVQAHDIYCLATAKHVVFDLARRKQREDVVAFVRQKSGEVKPRPLAALRERYGVDWFVHPDPAVDVALLPFELDTKQDDIKVVNADSFVLTERLFETYDAFFISYQPGLDSMASVSPVTRAGMISRINDDRTFYLDAFAFPGNSGSPVFLKPAPIRFDEGGRLSLGTDPLGGRLAGVIGAYVPYQEMAVSAQTGRPRVIFEENTGLAMVWSSDFLIDIVESEAFVKFAEKLAGAPERGPQP